MNRSAYHYKISGMKIWVVLFAALGSASPLLAQEPTPALVPQHSQTVLETLVKAGPVIIPLFLLSDLFRRACSCLLLDDPARSGRFERLHGDCRCAPA